MKFLDEYLPAGVWGYPCISSPRFSTTIARSDSGSEQRNQNRMHPLHTFRLPDAIREHQVMEDVRAHWMVMRGPLIGFPFRDPLDFASRALPAANDAPVVTALDQPIGTGNGFRTEFQLTKIYTRGSASYTRPIHLPVVASVTVAINGTTVPNGWTVERIGGALTFDVAPAAGQAITAGFLFDVPVRFSSDDDFDGIVQSFQTSGYADLVLSEITLCGVV
mgnify:CR=1 FL=1